MPIRVRLRYVQSDGVTREGESDELCEGATAPKASSSPNAAKGDCHQFWFMVAPEDGTELSGLGPFMRDRMGQVEHLANRLGWPVADHSNTGHPHSQAMLRRRNDAGHDRVLARDYIAGGTQARV